MQYKKGFTIVEIAVVVVIIALVATIAVAGFLQVQKQARDNKRETDVATFQTALEKYYDKNGEYPIDSYTFATMANLNAGGALIRNNGQQIGPSAKLSDLKNVAPNLDDGFGEPLRIKNVANYFDAVQIDRQGANARYFYMGGYSSKANGTAYGFQATFKAATGTPFSCGYWLDGNAGETATYIIGYYNEQKDAYVFKRGQQGNLFRWNTGNDPRCNLTT